MGLDILENEGTSEKACIEIEYWGFSVHFGLGFKENSIYIWHSCFSSSDVTPHKKNSEILPLHNDSKCEESPS